MSLPTTESQIVEKLPGAVSNLPGALLLLFALVLGAASSPNAGEFCSDYSGGVIDGNVLGTAPTQITVDHDCTFQNWPQSNPLTTTVTFATNDPSIYQIVSTGINNSWQSLWES